MRYKSYVRIAVWDSVDSPTVASYGWITGRKTKAMAAHVFSDVRGHPFMTSARRGGGGVGSKEDEVREVAWI